MAHSVVPEPLDCIASPLLSEQQVHPRHTLGQWRSAGSWSEPQRRHSASSGCSIYLDRIKLQARAHWVVQRQHGQYACSPGKLTTYGGMVYSRFTC